MPAWPVTPGVPAAGHTSSSGFWHPGQIDGCVKCPQTGPRPGPFTFRWSGTDRRGGHRCGQVTFGRRSSLAAMVAGRFRAGWRTLTVAEGPGPVPPGRDETEVGRIDRTAPKGKRAWWAES